MACFCGSACKDNTGCAFKYLGVAFAGFIGFSALLVLVLYIMGQIYNMSLGETFGRLRDAFRDSKPKLQ
ncbi:hypothetical protein BBBOND_0307670 [Babesia bigemina]|uniref:Uncharacterized protein n=1 Tax=Babesia bigemina TaxID=5866 RepID=A0A061D8L5_BABBI|nr:hypothetical protein BBBOND_0307670 [Babesia bigemina]CDR96863.1 hypothetical protein BBBOND_0307670 [Babesia bigemina]|eukprot:XP_012769049.1 hypothetical protein BBBOND_0307670 [Babesia bigemina]